MSFMMESKVTGVDKTSSGLKITVEPAAGGEATVLDADVCLVCVGRREYRDNLGSDDIGIEMDGKKIKVDDCYKTNIPSVYAIGDIINGPMLAHKAEDEGAMVAEYIATGLKPHLDYNKVPSVVYTHPEVAWVGKTEEQLKEAGVEYKKGSFPFMANSRARAVEDTTGFVKVLSSETGKILGAHIIGPSAGELIATFTVALEHGAAAVDLAETCFAHPTLSEAVKEACLGAAPSIGKPIHIQ